MSRRIWLGVGSAAALVVLGVVYYAIAKGAEVREIIEEQERQERFERLYVPVAVKAIDDYSNGVEEAFGVQMTCNYKRAPAFADGSRFIEVLGYCEDRLGSRAPPEFPLVATLVEVRSDDTLWIRFRIFHEERNIVEECKERTRGSDCAILRRTISMYDAADAMTEYSKEFADFTGRDISRPAQDGSR